MVSPNGYMHAPSPTIPLIDGLQKNLMRWKFIRLNVFGLIIASKTPTWLGNGNWIRLNAISPAPGKGERPKKTWHDTALPSHAGHASEDAYQVPSAVAWVQSEAASRYSMQGMSFGGRSQTSINLPK